MDTEKYHQLQQKVAVLEESMKTRKAEQESAYERLRADMAKRERDFALLFIVLWASAIAIISFIVT